MHSYECIHPCAVRRGARASVPLTYDARSLGPFVLERGALLHFLCPEVRRLRGGEKGEETAMRSVPIVVHACVRIPYSSCSFPLAAPPSLLPPPRPLPLLRAPRVRSEVRRAGGRQRKRKEKETYFSRDTRYVT